MPLSQRPPLPSLLLVSLTTPRCTPLPDLHTPVTTPAPQTLPPCRYREKGDRASTRLGPAAWNPSPVQTGNATTTDTSMSAVKSHRHSTRTFWVTQFMFDLLSLSLSLSLSLTHTHTHTHTTTYTNLSWRYFIGYFHTHSLKDAYTEYFHAQLS